MPSERPLSLKHDQQTIYAVVLLMSSQINIGIQTHLLLYLLSALRGFGPGSEFNAKHEQ